MDYPSIIKKSHWSDLLLPLGQYDQDQYEFALSTTYEQFWETCPKGEWLLHWIAQEGNTPHKTIVHAACQCARLALPYRTDKQQRPLKCIETTEKWCRGEATLEEVEQVRDAAWTTAYSVADYAADAGHAVYSAGNSAAYAAYFAAYAAASAFAYVAYAAYAADKSETALQKMQLQTADLVRSLIPMPTKLVDEYEHILKLKAFL